MIRVIGCGPSASRSRQMSPAVQPIFSTAGASIAAADSAGGFAAVGGEGGGATETGRDGEVVEVDAIDKNSLVGSAMNPVFSSKHSPPHGRQSWQAVTGTIRTLHIMRFLVPT